MYHIFFQKKKVVKPVKKGPKSSRVTSIASEGGQGITYPYGLL